MNKKQLLKRLNEERTQAEVNRKLAIESGASKSSASFYNGLANGLYLALTLAEELDDDDGEE